jgi:hypothetical protein
MQKLTSPHVKRIMAPYLKKVELDSVLIGRITDTMIRAIQDAGPLSKPVIHHALAEQGFELDLHRLGYIIMEAELNALICSGPMQGKQHSYAMLDDRVSNELNLSGDDALAELTRRFFDSHGPATEREFARWSGLTLTKARGGLELAKASLASVEIDEIVHWLGTETRRDVTAPDAAYLLHEYDECYLTYPTINFPDLPHADPSTEWKDAFYRPIIINGCRAGTWRRTIARKQVTVEANLFTELSSYQTALLKAEVDRFGEFLGMPARLDFPVLDAGDR